MAPEQARGKRSIAAPTSGPLVWCLRNAHRPPHVRRAKPMSDTIARFSRGRPITPRLSAEYETRVRAAPARNACLDRDPKQRLLRDIGEARNLIERTGARGNAQALLPLAARRSRVVRWLALDRRGGRGGCPAFVATFVSSRHEVGSSAARSSIPPAHITRRRPFSRRSNGPDWRDRGLQRSVRAARRPYLYLTRCARE
jgi:hypothetical protein